MQKGLSFQGNRNGGRVMAKKFLSGNEAFAEGIRLAKPLVISAYPITPQTTVVERLSEMVADGDLKSEFIHVESEHSALSCAIGASAHEYGELVLVQSTNQAELLMREKQTNKTLKLTTPITN